MSNGQGIPLDGVEELLDFSLGAGNRQVLDVVVALDVDSVGCSILWFPSRLPPLLQFHEVLSFDTDTKACFVSDQAIGLGLRIGKDGDLLEILVCALDHFE